MPFSVFQAVVLGIFGALAMAGVLIFAFVVGGSQGETFGEVEIWGTFDDTAIATVLRQLGEEDNRFKQIEYVEKAPDTYGQELTDALAAGRGPDIFIMRHDEALRDAQRVIPISYENLPADQFRNTFVDAASPFLGAQGVVGIPVLVDPLVMYWNKDMLASAGYSQPPAVWSELYGMAMKITQRDDSNSVRRATIAFGEYRNVSHAKDILSLLILQAGGPITRFSDGDLTPVLGGKSATVQQPAESALRFFAEFANPANAYYTWNRAQKSSREAFTGGTLALYLGPASEEPLIRQLNPNLDFAVAAVPQIESKEYKTNYGNVYGFAVSRTSDNPQGALSAVYLLAASKSSRLFSQALGIPSARRDVLAEKASGLDDLFNKQAIIAVGWVDPHPQKTDEIFRDMIESITSGSAKLSEAIQRAEEAMGKIITEQ